jgi:imidazolonepropionase-like amidohydrolase
MKPCRVVISVLLIVAASAWLSSCSQKPPQILAITHVTVIDATGAPPQPDMTLLIAAQHITALGPSNQISIPAGARIVDVTGKFLIPGLADMHIHLTGAGEPGGSREFMLPLLIANGVTSVRDMGGYLESLAPLRRDIEQGNRLGPRIIFAGPYLDGSPPFFQPSLVVTNSVQASEDVRMLIQRGVDFIKVQSALSREAYFAVADGCKREKVSFVGHVPDRVTAAEASDAGQRSIEHLTCVLRACAKDEPRLMREQFCAAPAHETTQQSRTRQFSWQTAVLRGYSEKNADKLIEKFRQKETWQVPTLALLRDVAYVTPETQHLSDSRNKYVPRNFMENWQKGYRQELQGVTPREFALRRAIIEKSMLLVAKMQMAGVRIMAGTDSAAPGLFPGFSLHEELALLVQAGLTPMQALQAATKSPAEFLGKSSTEGTVEKGRLANLVLLDANPLEDIANTQKIRAVIVLGKLLDRTALDALLTSAENFAATH